MSETLRHASYHVAGQQPNPRRMCRRGCVENPDGTWALCAWHEDKAQWAARESHLHDPAICRQCAALARSESPSPCDHRESCPNCGRMRQMEEPT